MSEQIADGTVETPIDWEARALKAEAKIIADKKAKEEQVITEPEEVVEPKGLTAEDVAKMIAADRKEQAIQSQEQAFENNQIQTNSMSISSEAPVAVASDFKMSITDYDALPQTAQREYYTKCKDKFGFISFS